VSWSVSSTRLSGGGCLVRDRWITRCTAYGGLRGCFRGQAGFRSVQASISRRAGLEFEPDATRCRCRRCWRPARRPPRRSANFRAWRIARRSRRRCARTPSGSGVPPVLGWRSARRLGVRGQVWSKGARSRGRWCGDPPGGQLRASSGSPAASPVRRSRVRCAVVLVRAVPDRVVRASSSGEGGRFPRRRAMRTACSDSSSRGPRAAKYSSPTGWRVGGPAAPSVGRGGERFLEQLDAGGSTTPVPPRWRRAERGGGEQFVVRRPAGASARPGTPPRPGSRRSWRSISQREGHSRAPLAVRARRDQYRRRRLHRPGGWWPAQPAQRVVDRLVVTSRPAPPTPRKWRQSPTDSGRALAPADQRCRRVRRLAPSCS